MLSFLLVGSGYRSEYYARVVRAYPDLFRALYLCRSPEKAALMTARTGLPATVSLAECEAFAPDFAVIAVDRSHIADVAEEWILRGLPVVTETPVGSTVPQLRRLRELHAGGAKIVCCEQYHRQPLLMAGLQAVAGGLIGEPSSASISFLHDYHAASLLRRALGTAGEAFTVRGEVRRSRVVDTDSRGGAILTGHVSEAERGTFHIAYASGKTALYDFCPVQYRTFIRSRHFTVRGERGEWSDCLVTWADGQNQPRRLFLMPEIPEAYRCLDSQSLRDARKQWKSELAPDTLSDEFAIASLLLDMGAYLADGPSPYPFDEAVDDAVFWLALLQAAAHPWEPVRSTDFGLD